ncbi:MAG: hypothetical protein ACJ74T_01855, partial [Pyrinomonadaceae bacterium]
MRPKLLVALVAALALSALLLAGGASAQRAARPANDNASSGPKSKRVFVGRGSETGQGSRVTITADDSLKDYSAYRSGDRFYVVLPKSAAGTRGGGGSGRGYSDMQVQQRGDSVVLSYRVQPGAKPRVEQKFNRLDVVFDVPGDAGQQANAANNNARQQQQQQTPPAESRNTAAQQNNQAQSTTTASSPNPTPERRQPTAEETARAQAANAAAANTTAPVTTAPQTTAPVDPAAQNPATTSLEPTQEPVPAATPAAEPQLAQAQPPTGIGPITTSQPVSNSQPASTLGAYLLQNWWIPLVLLFALVGLGLVINARRTTTAAPAPVEGLDDDSAVKLDESRATRAKGTSARALKDASAAAQAANVSAAETVSAKETVSAAEASDVNVKPLVAATALAGGAAVSKSRKQSRKEARQEAKRKKKGTPAEELADESAVAAPVAQETVVEEPLVEEATAASTVTEETALVEPVAEETLVHEETVVETPSVE